MNSIRKLIDKLPDDEVAACGDEIDIHLNPKIGADWMNKRLQKEVATYPLNKAGGGQSDD